MNPAIGEVYSIHHDVIKFVSDWREAKWFSPGTPVSSTNKTDCHDIAEILLNVALNTITHSPNPIIILNELPYKNTAKFKIENVRRTYVI